MAYSSAKCISCRTLHPSHPSPACTSNTVSRQGSVTWQGLVVWASSDMWRRRLQYKAVQFCPWSRKSSTWASSIANWRLHYMWDQLWNAGHEKLNSNHARTSWSGTLVSILSLPIHFIDTVMHVYIYLFRPGRNPEQAEKCGIELILNCSLFRLSRCERSIT